jgi:hypothetical protein
VVLLGEYANALETQDLRIADDLPLRERLKREVASFKTKMTAARNLVLDARESEHHADLAIAAAIALYLSNVGAGFTGEAAVAGYRG